MTESANANIADYYSAETFARIKAFADTKETPLLSLILPPSIVSTMNWWKAFPMPTSTMR